MSNEDVPFGGEDEDIAPPRKKGQQQKNNKPSQDDFSKQVDNKTKAMRANREKLGKLALDFMNMIGDKTLQENKGPLATQVEKEVLSELLQTINDINNDESEEMDYGTLSLMALFMKSFIKQRNRLNELEFKLVNIDKPRIKLE